MSRFTTVEICELLAVGRLTLLVEIFEGCQGLEGRERLLLVEGCESCLRAWEFRNREG